MEVQFLGTSSGVPTKSRNVSGIALVEKAGKRWHLIDCGEGTQHRILSSKLSVNKLETIFVTHVHGDHCYGLPGLIASAGLSGRTNGLTIVAPKGIKEWLESTIQYTQLYLPYELKFVATESLKTLKLGDLSVSAVELSHRVPSFAYVFEEHLEEISLDLDKLNLSEIPRSPAWGKLQKGENVEVSGELHLSEDFTIRHHFNNKLIICGDNDSPELLAEACIDCKLLVHESTYSETMASRAKEVGHSYASQVASFAESASIPNLILTHFSPRFSANRDDVHTLEIMKAEAASSYSGKLFLADDFDRYQLDKFGKLTLITT